MRHRVATFKIGRTGAHRRAMLANMVSSLFANGKIETTLVKAKAARSFAEKMITLGKKGDIHNRRQAFSKLRDKDAVKLLFDEIAPGYAGRNGGYTRILKLGKRRGDAAEMCILALVEASVEAPKAEEAKAE
jgi:large subunit ribosomal protein L17